jgi:hypothetical protein
MLFADLVDTSEEWLDVESYTLARENGQLIPTVKPHEGAITFGVHGHPVYLLERKHESWYTTYKHSGNLHGDPRNFIRMFTPNGARFFSFLMLSPTEMIIPGALEMNAAIDSFNKDLSIKDRIPIRFYTTGRLAVSDYTLLSRFVEKGELPMAEDGFYQIHDASLHSSSIVYSEEITHHARNQFQAIMGFLSFIEHTHPKLHEKLSLHPSYRQILRSAAYEVDLNANAFILGFPSIYMTLTPLQDYIKANVYDRFYNSGKTPQRVLGDFVTYWARLLNTSETQELQRAVIVAHGNFENKVKHMPAFTAQGMSLETFVAQLQARQAFIRKKLDP